MAYLIGTEPELDAEIHQDAVSLLQRSDPEGLKRLGSAAGSMCRHQSVRNRVNTILSEAHEARLAIRMEDVKVNSALVTDGLLTVYDRCMQIVPVKNGRGDVVGTFKFDPNSAVKALELLGLEQGMFERKHKHLHAKANPLEGNRSEIIGRLGSLTDQLSDDDLYALGLRRLSVSIEVGSERIDPVEGESGPALQPLPEASGVPQ